MIREKRGVIWDRSQITIKSVGKGIWSMKKKRLKNDRYHYDQGEERNPMG